MRLTLKKWIENIQAAAYNVRKVYILRKSQYSIELCSPQKFKTEGILSSPHPYWVSFLTWNTEQPAIHPGGFCTKRIGFRTQKAI